MSTKYVFGAVPCRKDWTFVSKIEETENASFFQTNSSKNANQIMFIYCSIWSLAGRILAKQQVFAFASFSRSKVCLRFSMIRKPKNQSCVSKIGLFGEHCRDRVSFSFFQNVPGKFCLRCKYLCSLFFTQRNFSLCFNKIHKDWTSDSKFFKIYSSEEGHLFIFLECAEQKPWVKKYKSYCFLQKILFFSMKSVEFPQFSRRWLSDCIDPYQLSWLPQ